MLPITSPMKIYPAGLGTELVPLINALGYLPVFSYRLRKKQKKHIGLHKVCINSCERYNITER